MKFSAVTSAAPSGISLFHGSFPAVFRAAKEAGFDCVQLTAKEADEIPAEEIRRQMDGTGLSVSAIATGRVYTVDGLSMGSSREENRTACLRRLRELADCGASLGGAALVIGSVRGRWRDAESREDYDRLFETSLREISEYCEGIQVPVILEAIDRFDADAYCDPGEALALVERIQSPALHLYLDVMHLYNEGFDPAESIRRYGARSWQIDLSGEDRLPPPQSERIDFPAVAAAIRDSGFDGPVSFEYASDAPAEDLAYIKSLLK